MAITEREAWVQQEQAHLTRTRTAEPLLVWAEDWLTLWLGCLVVLFVLAGVRPALPTYRWTTGWAFAKTASESRPAVEQLSADALAAGEAPLATAAAAVVAGIDSGDRSAIGAAAKRLGSAAAGESGLKRRAADLGRKLSREAGASPGNVLSPENLKRAAIIGVAYLILSALGIALSGGAVRRYLLGFPIVFGLAWLAQVIAGNALIHYWGLEYVIFALLLGLTISNVIGVPAWMVETIRTDYFIKTGLVILGASILFDELKKAGPLGILQALLVVSVVWYACFWLARRLRVDDEFAVMLSTAVSICGVSAAIAACGAIQGDRKKLSYVTSLTLVCAVPMMLLQPWIARAVGMPDVVAGAWLGGTLDTSGAVVAAGELISPAAMKAGVIVKFSQNMFIGLAAFMLAVWWAFKEKAGGRAGDRPDAGVIWERFPKFVLGFVAMSILFSFFLEPELVAETAGVLGGLRTMWFALAFVCIGLETRLGELFTMGEGRPAAAFLGAQAINVLWTLLLAYLLFGGIFFPVPKLG